VVRGGKEVTLTSRCASGRTRLEHDEARKIRPAEEERCPRGFACLITRSRSARRNEDDGCQIVEATTIHYVEKAVHRPPDSLRREPARSIERVRHDTYHLPSLVD